MGLEEKFLEYRGGMRVRFLLNEHNNRAPVLVIHGTGEDVDAWRFLHPYFDCNDFALNLLELRGHGKSGGALRSVFADATRDAARLISSYFSEEPPLVLAIGSGAFVAARIAADWRLGVRGVVLVDAPLALRRRRGFAERVMTFFAPGGLMADPFASPGLCSGNDSDEAPAPGRVPRALVRAWHRESAALFSRFAARPDLPVFALIAEDDSLIDVAAAAARAEDAGWDVQVIRKCPRGILVSKQKIDHLERILAWMARLCGIALRKNYL
jgi:alpha-beta hydrolase superfamily lysophospholipase